jgi:hypothetical protein
MTKPTAEAVRAYQEYLDTCHAMEEQAGLPPTKLDDTPLERLTCADCPHIEVCEWAFDPYNTDGDCLAMK